MALGCLAARKKGLGIWTPATDLERTKVLVPIPFWHFRVRINPKSKVDSSLRGRWLGPASDQLGVDAHLREGHPSLRSWALAAKNHATQLIEEAFCLFRIGSVAKFLGQLEKFLLLTLLCLNAVLDEFNQHAVGAQPAILGEVADLSRDLNGEADALTNSLISRAHSTSMHHNGVFSHTILDSNGYHFMRGPARLGGDHRVCRGRASNIRRRERRGFFLPARPGAVRFPSR